MLNSLPVSVVVGILLGFLAGLGVGGGSLLVVWLTLVLGMQYADARSINLLFFLPSALIATLFHHRRGKLPLKQLLPGMIGGCISAAAISLLGAKADTALLKKLFGFLLLFTGFRELCFKTKK